MISIGSEISILIFDPLTVFSVTMTFDDCDVIVTTKISPFDCSVILKMIAVFDFAETPEMISACAFPLTETDAFSSNESAN